MSYESPTLPPQEDRARESVELVRELRRKLFWNDLRLSFREAPGQTLIFFISFFLIGLVGFAILYEIETMGNSAVLVLLLPFYFITLFCSGFFSLTGPVYLSGPEHIQGQQTPRDIRGPYFQLAPLRLSALFKESLRVFLRWLTLFSALVFLLFFALVRAERLSLFACLLFTLLWVNIQLLAELRDLGLAVSRRCFGNWEDPAFKPFGWWPGLLILAFPFFLVAGFSFLFPLTILVLLIPLDLKAYRIWQKHVLPNSGRHELWFGAWPKPAVNPGEERIGAAAEEKKAEHKPRLIGKSLGWGVVQELLNVEKQDWKGAISVFVILYFIMLAFCLPLFLFLAWEAGDISEFWEILLVIPWALAVIMFLLSLFALLADGIDSHFVIRSAGSLNKGTIPCSSDWVHLLPLPGSLVIRKCLHWLALHFLKLSSPLLVLIPALFFMGDIGGAALLCLFLGLMAVVMLGVVLNVVLGYREPSRRRRWGA